MFLRCSKVDRQVSVLLHNIVGRRWSFFHFFQKRAMLDDKSDQKISDKNRKSVRPDNMPDSQKNAYVLCMVRLQWCLLRTRNKETRHTHYTR